MTPVYTCQNSKCHNFPLVFIIIRHGKCGPSRELERSATRLGQLLFSCRVTIRNFLFSLLFRSHWSHFFQKRLCDSSSHSAENVTRDFDSQRCTPVVHCGIATRFQYRKHDDGESEKRFINVSKQQTHIRDLSVDFLIL